jgi:hypothetical protein
MKSNYRNGHLLSEDQITVKKHPDTLNFHIHYRN